MMTEKIGNAVKLRVKIERAGCQLALVHGEIQVRAPRGELTTELVSLVEENGEALKLLLLDEAAQRSERCAALAREVMAAAERLADAREDDVTGAHAVAQMRDALDSLVILTDRNRGEEPEHPDWCWRCGASMKPPSADVATQIAININAAGWQAWAPELFRTRMLENLRDGDRIIGIRGGAVIIRRADGMVVEVSKYQG